MLKKLFFLTLMLCFLFSPAGAQASVAEKAPFCGNHVVEYSEQCEEDADCAPYGADSCFLCMCVQGFSNDVSRSLQGVNLVSEFNVSGEIPSYLKRDAFFSLDLLYPNGLLMEEDLLQKRAQILKAHLHLMEQLL